MHLDYSEEPKFRKEFLTNQTHTQGTHRELFPELMGFERFGDISAAVDRFNITYGGIGKISFDYSEDQSPEEDGRDLAEKGLIRTIIRVDNELLNNSIRRNELLLLIDRISAYRVLELNRTDENLFSPDLISLFWVHAEYPNRDTLHLDAETAASKIKLGRLVMYLGINAKRTNNTNRNS